jgi:Chaperone of endosialidase
VVSAKTQTFRISDRKNLRSTGVKEQKLKTMTMKGNQFMKNRRTVTVITIILFTLGFSALPQRTQAVSPPPDGGYPGFNTAEGTNSLKSLTTGVANVGVGWYSLFSNTDGSLNTGVGVGTLLFNVGDQSTSEGLDNTAVGAAALLFNTTGSNNTAVGAAALSNNTTGGANTATGYQALLNNTGGFDNVATGLDALGSNTEGIYNTAYGDNALFNTIGSSNIALGSFAGYELTTGNNNIDIGNRGVAGESDTIRIGDPTDAQTRTFIAGISGATASGGLAVYVNSNGRLGTATSSARFKQDIHSMDKASETVLGLKPVTFRYKKDIDPDGIPQFGLVAEEVEKVNPDLVVRDKEGKPYSVRYDQVNAMLLNEFLKEHRKVEKLEATVAQQQTNFQSRLAEQEMQIQALASGLQKVSARVEMSKPATKVVSNLP